MATGGLDRSEGKDEAIKRPSEGSFLLRKGARTDDDYRTRANVRALAISYVIGLPLALLALVFLPVGRLDWSPGWFFVGFLIVVDGISALVLWRVKPVIFRARSRLQPGTERWDRILLALMLPARVVRMFCDS